MVRRRLRRFLAYATTFALGPLVAASLITWWFVGDISERGGYDRVIDLPQTAAAAHVALAIGLVAAAGSIVATTYLIRQNGAPQNWRRYSTVSVLFGVATGYSFRVMSSRTYGSNIGGGGLILLWPALALILTLVGVVTLWSRTSQSSPAVRNSVD
jgi:hypothetical protein